MEIRLPLDKLENLKGLITSWLARHSCTKGDLESLVGHLGHACVIVSAGRTFLRRLLELLSVARRARHFLRLNSSHCSDLYWWQAFLTPLNYPFFPREATSPSAVVGFFSDASGSTVSSPGSELGSDSISFKELLPIVWACAVWGRHRRRHASVIAW